MALDVGLNYGECLFSARYKPEAVIIGIEANPRLIPLLKKTHSEHPNADQIRVINALATDVPQEDQVFYLNKGWSGGSTAIAGIASDNSQEIEEIRVRATTVDQIVSNETAEPHRLVFKIDVEGFEPMVLSGMGETLSLCQKVIGYIEVNTGFVSQSGWKLEDYSDLLCRYFDIYIPLDRKELRLKRIKDLSELSVYARNKANPVSDIIVVKGFDDLSWLAPGWQIA